jgi:uncharacterized membrane protein
VGFWIAPAIALSALAWLALLAAAPALSVPVAGVLYAIGSFICHQIPERSFYLHGFQLPVCARCFGLYAGGATGSLAAVFAGRALSARAAWSHRSPGTGGKGALYVATAIAALPTIATLALEWGAGWRVSNVVRAASGLPLGFAVAFVVVRAVATLHYDECAPRRPIGHGQPPAST